MTLCGYLLIGCEVPAEEAAVTHSAHKEVLIDWNHFGYVVVLGLNGGPSLELAIRAGCVSSDLGTTSSKDNFGASSLMVEYISKFAAVWILNVHLVTLRHHLKVALAVDCVAEENEAGHVCECTDLSLIHISEPTRPY